MHTRKRHLLIAGLFVVGLHLGVPPYALRVPSVLPKLETLPSQLTDTQFWQYSSEFSEPDGAFRSDNLLSNETWFQYVIPELNRITKSGRVYLGVGPEQNFTYIAALKPKIAFIIDIRRGNFDLHLMYKALFDLSKDRSEFVARLFSKKPIESLRPQSTASQLFREYAKVETSEAIYKENLRAIQDDLMKAHGFLLLGDDLAGIEYVYHAFYNYGTGITYSSTIGGFRGRSTYAQLMAATDASGQARSYLANEENFLFLKDLQRRNLIIPVIGNFGGPKALRAIAKYVKDNQATVSAFYVSNVEQYLIQDNLWRDFCLNATTLPIDSTSTFIRSVRRGRYGQGAGLNSVLGSMQSDLSRCAEENE